MTGLFYHLYKPRTSRLTMVPSGERKDPCSWFLLDGLAVETIGFGAQGWKQAGMAELADAGDLKSPGRKAVWVQVPLPAPSLSSKAVEG